jgi:hypothetical protein
MIIFGDKLAEDFGFTEDKFDGWLWEDGEFMWISFIISLDPGQGNLKKLFDAIESKGYKLIVPTPSSRMVMICKKRGMVLTNAKYNGEYLEVMMNPLKHKLNVG